MCGSKYTCALLVMLMCGWTLEVQAQAEACSDRSEHCDYWFKGGYCTNVDYQTWMAQNCASSCNTCEGSDQISRRNQISSSDQIWDGLNEQVEQLRRMFEQLQQKVNDQERQIISLVASSDSQQSGLQAQEEILGQIRMNTFKQNELLAVQVDQNKKLTGQVSAMVLLSDNIDGEGWIIFQHRQKNTSMIDFNRNWVNFTQGFGDSDNFWLGLDKIHRICNKDHKCELRMDMTADDRRAIHANYNSFFIDGPSANYTLHLSGYNGNVGVDLMNFNYPDYRANGMMFSTFDRDNDGDNDSNCAEWYHGAWWHSGLCGLARLNGPFDAPAGYSSWTPHVFNPGTWKREQLISTEMKMRRIP